MAKTLVENRVCQACAADVRPGSLFCYNCGASVASAFIAAKENNIKKPVSGTLQTDKPNENNSKITARLEEKTVDEIVEKPIPKPEIDEDIKLKSAANLRRRARSFQRQKVEVVWEEPENTPNA